MIVVHNGDAPTLKKVFFSYNFRPVPDNAFLKKEPKHVTLLDNKNEVVIDDPSACSPSQMARILQGKGVN